MRTVAIVAAPASQVLDVTGPAEVFSRSTRILCADASSRQDTSSHYRTLLISATDAPRIETTAGVEIAADATYAAFDGDIDTLLVAGGAAVEDGALAPGFLAWLRDRESRVRRFGSVCTGVFALGYAGLLSSRRVATHWEWAARLATQFPDARVDAESIFVRDGKFATSAGVTAGIDLSLALVEEDHGAALVSRIARELVIPFRRHARQSQYSAALTAQAADHVPIREVQSWLSANPRAKATVRDLAARAGMSERHFLRVFKREAGMTVGAFVEQVRVEAVCRRLSESSYGLDRLAAECGFNSADSLRRAFVRVVGVSPREYRAGRRA